ncbi:MAG: cell division protein FtsA [Candidatus Wildermuthbacteria bacterium RIFCSPLOWO2_02_FULL_47_9c]|uniref:Cell division protein FtsA n=2 Tax=Parcubacteria group TaxID=1794811 RepID=A0A837IKM1_9BACT|nr:MAG: Cell division protein ftsA [Candidatus Yanofskybacteria bacterium GW2011_GWC1_48_11]KKW04054.1 MAG: Cell division protein ftsA [Parcubacteria group bacterium GW2011_GWB1_49_12]KKW08845.1 MAG: Cell division protein ftsA [Parcubacteria group bacterium GW2011_GWA1_49_26]KKW13840.1 MAG: Cell division protein ftsA [Parcubacteria group bacterium GW2011_GWA2_50_10]OHA61768.1 MAG: cell division protein FtsA [Candidatus Wildermuthbacteria bacterium GWA1_49_26]OHA65595.1 MAG: cell division prote
MRAEIIAGLDIGTHSLKMAVLQKRGEGETPEILGFGEESSSGVRKGSVVHTDEVSKKILALKDRLSTISGKSIREVIVSIGGSHIFCVPSHGIVAVSRADGQISQEDVDRVLQAAQAFSLPSNKEILEAFPQQFVVDGEERVKEVVGMKGVRLEADVLAVCGFSPYIRNLTEAVIEAGFEIADTVPAPLMAEPAVLGPQQKEVGVAVLDMGAGTTGLAVYEQGDLIHAAVFPVGSENITNDIAVGLRCEPDLAERIKVGLGVSRRGKRSEKLETAEGQPLAFSQKLLSRIVQARVREIFQLVNKELKQISRQGALPGGVVLVGGGAKLPKIVEEAKRELKVTVRLGKPQGVVSPQSDPAFLGVIGLLLGAARDGYYGRGSYAGAGFLQKVRRVFRPFIP